MGDGSPLLGLDKQSDKVEGIPSSYVDGVGKNALHHTPHIAACGDAHKQRHRG